MVFVIVSDVNSFGTILASGLGVSQPIKNRIKDNTENNYARISFDYDTNGLFSFEKIKSIESRVLNSVRVKMRSKTTNGELIDLFLFCHFPLLSVIFEYMELQRPTTVLQ